MSGGASAGTATTWDEHIGIEHLVVRAGFREARVPPDVAALLFSHVGPGITADPEADLLHLEALLRTRAHDAARAVRECARLVATGAERQRELRGRWLQRRPKARLRRDLAEAQQLLAESSSWEATVLHRLRQLRDFVIELQAPEGLLAEAARGWARSPDVPEGVVVFADESVFLTDSRRAREQMPMVIGGETLGELWRRDGDDPTDQPMARPGCWTVGHIERTQEIYAVRRCDQAPDVVWLLGREFSSVRAYDVVQPLRQRRREPNSLLLVAEAVAVAQGLHHTRAAS